MGLVMKVFRRVHHTLLLKLQIRYLTGKLPCLQHTKETCKRVHITHADTLHLTTRLQDPGLLVVANRKRSKLFTQYHIRLTAHFYHEEENSSFLQNVSTNIYNSHCVISDKKKSSD
jgi:hypothetical protein